MKQLKISRVINSVDELFNAKEYDAIFEGFVNTHRGMMNRKEFVSAFVVETNPKDNYGQSFDIYEYFIINGLHRLMKISIHSCLDNGPMYQAFILDGMLAISYERPIEKCEHNRNLARKHKMIIF